MSTHQRACAWKHRQLQENISSLSPSFSFPLSQQDRSIHELSIPQLVQKTTSNQLSMGDVLTAYAKKSLIAHERTNCLSHIRFQGALLDHQQVPPTATDQAKAFRERPLLGVPVSVKDTIDVEGCDSTIACSRNLNKPAPSSSAIVRLLQDAGALVHCKTTVPPLLFALETTSDVFGTTRNPVNPAFSCGASSGGGAALLGGGGTKIDVGSDIGGSVRIPAAFCGLWSLKGSRGRFPVEGHRSSVQGLEGVDLVCAPMAGSLADLGVFWKAVVGMKPWEYDHSCIPLEWRDVNILEARKKVKWGVVWDDGLIPLTPACKRAIDETVAALKDQGHEVVDLTRPTIPSTSTTAIPPPEVIPSIQRGLGIANQLMFADGAEQLQAQLEPSERASPLVTSLFPLFPLLRLLKAVKSTVELLPRWACRWMKRGLVRSARFVGGEALKEVVAVVLHAGDKPKDLTKIGTEGIIGMGEKSIVEERELVKARDAYREEWRKRVWEEENLDFVICPVMPCPAVRHGEAEGAKFPRGSDGEKGKRGRKGLGFEAPGMTLIWNLLDYSAGVMPISTVDKDVDRLPEEFWESGQFERMGNVAKAVWRVYGCVGEDIRREPWEGDRGSFEEMHGLPVGIQIVGKRWEEEKVLEGMNVVNEALRVWNSKAAT